MSRTHLRLKPRRKTAAAAIASALCMVAAVVTGTAAHAAAGIFSGTCTLDHVDGNGDTVWRLASASVPGGTYRTTFVRPGADVFCGYGMRADKYVTYYTDYSGERLGGMVLVSRAETRKGTVTAETASFTCG